MGRDGYLLGWEGRVDGDDGGECGRGCEGEERGCWGCEAEGCSGCGRMCREDFEEAFDGN